MNSRISAVRNTDRIRCSSLLYDINIRAFTKVLKEAGKLACAAQNIVHGNTLRYVAAFVLGKGVGAAAKNRCRFLLRKSQRFAQPANLTAGKQTICRPSRIRDSALIAAQLIRHDRIGSARVADTAFHTMDLDVYVIPIEFGIIRGGGEFPFLAHRTEHCISIHGSYRSNELSTITSAPLPRFWANRNLT